ncbi:MAG: radical SAM protein [Candidatus Altiarchaeota archaeon]
MIPKNAGVIVELTRKCNLSCKYCFYEKGDITIDLDTLNKILEEVISLGKKKVTFQYFGGEPFIEEIPFLEEVMDLKRMFKDKLEMKIKIQTNGTLIDEQTVKFIKDNNIGLGLSIDGPKDIHDSQRVYCDGGGTHDDIMNSVKILREHNVRFGCICILTRIGLNKIPRILNFFKSINLGFRLNPIRPYPPDNSLAITPQEYGIALTELFDLWYPQFDKIRIKTLMEYSYAVTSNKTSGCWSIGNCLDRLIHIDVFGNVYPCDTFANEKSMQLGNISDRSLKEILVESYPKFARNRIADCLGCKWKELCNGGCTYNAFKVHGSIYTRDYYCASRRMVFEHISNRLGITVPS